MSRRRDGGLATAELAAVLPVLMLLVGAALTAVSVMVTQVRCVDAAGDAARAAARGEPTAVVRSVAARAGPGTRLEVGGDAENVRVTVSATAAGGGGLLPALRVTASAVALREPESSDEP